MSFLRYGLGTLSLVVLQAVEASITIPRGREVTIDGAESEGEWSDAVRVTIAVSGDRHVTVRVKHDGVNLLVAFTGLPSGGVPFFRVPEVVVDPKNDSEDVWNANDWWFHASARDCAARGKYNDYSTCTLEAQEWSATNLGRGVVVPEVMELRIPLRLLELEITSRSTFGIAFNVTDTQRNWDFWPAMAQLSKPATWARAKLAP